MRIKKKGATDINLSIESRMVKKGDKRQEMDTKAEWTKMLKRGGVKVTNFKPRLEKLKI